MVDLWGGVPYSYRPKIYHFQLLLTSKRQYLLGTFCKNKVGTLLLSKKMSTYSGQKAQHFLKEAICFKLQRSFPCLTKGNFIHKLQFSFQTKYDFVQETVPLQSIEHSSKHAVIFFLKKCSLPFKLILSLPSIIQYFFQNTRF